MSEPREPELAKLVVGLLFRDFEIRNQILETLNARFGPVDFLMEPAPFTYTTYYDKEMGQGILRQVGSFTDLVHPESITDIKLFTNELEGRFTEGGKRQVNIDPGILTEERLILATGKNFTHRVYLRSGIYADLTLVYYKGSYQTLPWTYPDYREPRLIHYLGALRRILLFQRDGKLYRKSVH